MENLIQTATGEVSITLKEITDLINIRHNDSMLKVEKLSLEPSFGSLRKTRIVYNEQGQEIDTYILNKKQAIAVGAKLNNALLMKVIDRVEELENNKKPMTTNQILLMQSQELVKMEEIQLQQSQDLSQVKEKVDYLENKSPVLYNQLKALEDKRKAKTRELVGYNPSDADSVVNYSKTIRTLTKKFKDRYCIARYADLPKDKFQDAMSWLNNISLVDLI